MASRLEQMEFRLQSNRKTAFFRRQDTMEIDNNVSKTITKQQYLKNRTLLIVVCTGTNTRLKVQIMYKIFNAVAWLSTKYTG